MKNSAPDLKVIKTFLRYGRIIVTSGEGKQLWVTLHAEPNFKRFIVVKGNIEVSFERIGDAVKFYNAE